MCTTQNTRQINRTLHREEDRSAIDRQIYTTQNNRYRERLLEREEKEEAANRQMYTTQNNRQRERLLDREEEEEKEVATDRCIQHRTIYRDKEIARQRGGGGSYKQIDVYNIEQYIKIERLLDREEEVAIDKCMQHRK